jgi:hypothetical protein
METWTGRNGNGMTRKLQKIKRDFLNEWKHIVLSPYTARDACCFMSDEFICYLEANGFLVPGPKNNIRTVTGFKFADNACTIVTQGHTAVLIEDTVWDWTARQFDEKAPVPLLMPLSQWEAEWKPLILAA